MICNVGNERIVASLVRLVVQDDKLFMKYCCWLIVLSCVGVFVVQLHVVNL